MVEISVDQPHPQSIRKAYPSIYILIAGSTLGVVFWVLMSLLGHFITDPVLCRGTASVIASCSQSHAIASNLAAIITGLVGIGILIKLLIPRPAISLILVTGILWGLGDWEVGLQWFEAVIWSILLYTISLLLFTWLTRYNRLSIVLLASLIVLIVARSIVSF